MVCVKCGNPNNFIVFKGEVIYITNGHTNYSEKAQVRAMCNECFSCDVIIEKNDENLQEVAA